MAYPVLGIDHFSIWTEIDALWRALKHNRHLI